MNLVFKITRPAAPLFLYWKHEYEFNVNNDTIQKFLKQK